MIRRQGKEWIEKALARDPNFTEAHYNLGNTAWQLGRPEEAVARYERTLALIPGHVDAWVNKGRSLQQLGRRDEAAAAFRATLRIAPTSGKAWENLSFTRSFAEDDEEVEAMRAAQDRVDPRNEDASSLHFALEKARLDQGNIDTAFAHYAVGNGIAHTMRPYDIAAEERMFNHIQQQFSPTTIERLRGMGAREARPIFVLGMPRSGTILIEQILASHPRFDSVERGPCQPRPYRTHRVPIPCTA